MSALCLSHILHILMEIWRGKNGKKAILHDGGSSQWADSDSDREPEDNDFLPDGDDFVTESSGEAVLDEPV